MSLHPNIDINECTNGSHTCHRMAKCTNSIGSFSCACKIGYTGTGQNCSDVNECKNTENPCNDNLNCEDGGIYKRNDISIIKTNLYIYPLVVKISDPFYMKSTNNR